MDITKLSPAMNLVNTQTATGTAVLKKAMDTHDEQGAKMVQMMQESVANQTGVGSLFDVKA